MPPANHDLAISAPPAAASAVRERAFAQARRHSIWVRVLKVLLPAAAVIMAAGFAGYTYVMTPGNFTVQTDSTAFADGKIVMSNPKIDGFTRNNQPYTMRASRAIQDLDRQNVIALEQIDAKLPVGTDNWATVDATSGIYDRDGNTLDFTGALTVSTTDGLVAKMESAFVDLGKGDLRSDKPVDITMNGTHITADAMTVAENGKVLIFEKRVRMNIDAGRVNGAQRGETNADTVQ